MMENDSSIERGWLSYVRGRVTKFFFYLGPFTVIFELVVVAGRYSAVKKSRGLTLFTKKTSYFKKNTF